jgi:hypothetical protein
MNIDNRIFAIIASGPIVGLAVKYAGAFLFYVLGLSIDWQGLSASSAWQSGQGRRWNDHLDRLTWGDKPSA